MECFETKADAERNNREGQRTEALKGDGWSLTNNLWLRNMGLPLFGVCVQLLAGHPPITRPEQAGFALIWVDNSDLSGLSEPRLHGSN